MPTSSPKSRTAVWQRFATAASLALACTVVHADPVDFSGSVADCTNPALVGSGPNLPAPTCDSTQSDANNVAVYNLNVPFGGFTDFNFGGFSDFLFSSRFVSADRLVTSGIQPLLSLFRGTGASAVYFAASSQDIDDSPDLRVFLTAGNYTFTISNLANASIAELRQRGTLGEGFIGRGNPAYVGDGSYFVTVTTPTGVPEPDTLWLASIGLVALLLGGRRRARIVAVADRT